VLKTLSKQRGRKKVEKEPHLCSIRKTIPKFEMQTRGSTLEKKEKTKIFSLGEIETEAWEKSRSKRSPEEENSPSSSPKTP